MFRPGAFHANVLTLAKKVFPNAKIRSSKPRWGVGEKSGGGIIIIETGESVKRGDGVEASTLNVRTPRLGFLGLPRRGRPEYTVSGNDPKAVDKLVKALAERFPKARRVQEFLLHL
ncbi:MAG: hypothetical protein QW343_00380 [Candidatus Norongarragalinales archaeon]